MPARLSEWWPVSRKVDWAPSFKSLTNLYHQNALSTQHIGIIALVPSDGIICERVWREYLIYCLVYCLNLFLPQKLAFLGQHFSAIYFASPWSMLVTLPFLSFAQFLPLASFSTPCSSYKTASRPIFFVNSRMYSSRNKLLQVVNLNGGQMVCKWSSYENAVRLSVEESKIALEF